MGNNALTPRDVFDRAHEIPSTAERRAYLDQACAGDPELREKVEALLRAHDEAGSFLQHPAFLSPETGPYQAADGLAPTGPYRPADAPLEPSCDSAAETVPPGPHDEAAPPAEGPGTCLGPYRLLEEIGHGGMGAVYRAEQVQPVRRQVALKIIKPGMDSAQVVARFEAERQALALMDHLNIARVLDAGATPEGRPFFVMELVQGVPITQYCDDNGLTIRQRLELFVPVCQAIQHAHQKGVIHRDIKPSNVLVTLHEGKPFPKVIDFGIAKAIEQPLTDSSPETQVGTVVGTLEYMSPEQADLSPRGVDTRSDIYSLGVLLYELLTGTTPLGRARLRGLALFDVLRLIAEEEPPRPSARVAGLDPRGAEVAARRQTEPARLARLLRGELDWIAVKALDKDRDRRYQTAAGLARDVERYLHDDPVEACPPSARYRLAKFARKHRALLASAGAVVAVLVLGVVGLTAGLIAVNRAKLQVEAEQTQTRRALDMADELIQAMVRNRTRLADADKPVLRRALETYRGFALAPGEAPAARALAAETHFRIASYATFLIDERGYAEEAEAEYGRAIQGYGQLVSEFPGSADYRKQLARSHFNLGYLLSQLGKPAEAEAAFRRAADLHEQLAADFPGEGTYLSDLADDLNDLGVVLRDQHHPAAAETVCRRGIDIRKQLAALFPDLPLYRVNLAAGYHNLGNLVRDQGQPAAALASYGSAIELLGPVVTQGGQVANARLFLRNAHWDRANALGQLGRHAEAVADWQRAIELDDGPDQEGLRLFQATARAEERLRAIVAGKAGAASGVEFYNAARLFARAAAEAAAKNEESLQARYVSRALALLEQARAAGFFRDAPRFEGLMNDSELKSLQPRADFQKFVAGLKTAAGAK